MFEDDWNLRYTAMFWDTSENPWPDGEYVVEYYDLFTNTWELLTQPQPVSASGEFEAIFPLATDMAWDEELRQKIANWLAAGAFPVTRLTTADSQGMPTPDVAAVGGVIMPDPETQMLNVSFGNMWVVEPGMVQTMEEASEGEQYSKVTVLRPPEDHPLYLAKLAAVHDPSIFASYVVGVSVVKVVDADSADGSSDETSSDGTTGDTSNDVFLLQSQVELQQIQLETMAQSNAAKDSSIESYKLIQLQLQADLEEKENEVASLQAVVDGINTTAAPLSEVYTKVVQEVEASTTALQDSRYTLENLSLNIKTHVKNSDDGLYVQVIDAAAAAAAAANNNAEAISEFQVAIGVATPSTPTNAIAAPKVTGLTETACRKRLALYGLKQRAIYQTSENQVIGQAFKQIPEPGEDILPNQEVTVIFAKAPDTFN